MTRAAIYCRLSKEDGNEASQSIQAQQAILTQYVTAQNWQLVGTYIDDGFSGTNFARPDFQRLLADIALGNIDVLVTKDLSRLGRNYLQTGYYIEEFFPANQVRYIALNDNVDTGQEEANEFAPFKNIINEWYAKDISKKIRFTLDNQARQGLPRNTVFPIFGYTYNERFERVPDADTAPIVQFIFQNYLQTGSAKQVAQNLTAQQVKLPQFYNAIKYGYNKAKVLRLTEAQLTTWRSSSVRDILSKREYLGTYITAKTKSLSYKNKKRLTNPHCFVFTERYPALVDQATFARVQTLLKRGRSGQVTVADNPFKGLVFCAHCGWPLKFERKRQARTREYTFWRYYCANPQCHQLNTIQRDQLVWLVEQELQQLQQVLQRQTSAVQTVVERYWAQQQPLAFDVTREQQQYLLRRDTLQKYLQKLFEQQVEGLIPVVVYQQMAATYRQELQLIEAQIKRYQTTTKPTTLVAQVTTSMQQLQQLPPNRAWWRACITAIKVAAMRTNPKAKRYNYQIKLCYAGLDAALQEFQFGTRSHLC